MNPRQSFKQQASQIKKDERLPVYYDSGTRFSILSEMIQVQPTQERTENPFDQADDVIRQPSRGTNSGAKNSLVSHMTG